MDRKPERIQDVFSALALSGRAIVLRHHMAPLSPEQRRARNHKLRELLSTRSDLDGVWREFNAWCDEQGL